MRRQSRFAPVALVLALWPLGASAQTAVESAHGVGVITTLAGTATVARASLPSPQPLRFKDDVFLRDRISTAEKSTVRVLLGGKALVTVREFSELTITEETGHSAVDLSSGKISMGVLRQRMRPGEVIEIRTPNAIATIRGTVLVVELIPEPGGGSGAPRFTTKVHVLHGLVEVSDPKNPGAPPAEVGTLESWSRTGSDPSSLVPMNPSAVEQVLGGLHSAPQIAEGPSEFISALTVREQAKALAVAELLAPEASGAGGGGDGGATGSAPAGTGATSSGVTDAPVSPLVTGSIGQPAGGGSGGPGPTGLAQFAYTGQTVALQGNLYSLIGAQTDPRSVPILEAVNSSLAVAQNLVGVSGTASLTSSGSAPLLFLDPAQLSASRVLELGGASRLSLTGSLFQDLNGGLKLQTNVLELSGSAGLTGSGSSALVDLIGSSATTGGSLLTVSGAAVMDLLAASAPLLNLTQGAALTANQGLLNLSGSAVVKLSQLTSLTASSLTVAGHALTLSGRASMTVSGDLFRIGSGGTLTLTNGALLSLSGGSVLNVGGALINFTGTGGTISITNNLCAAGGCTTIGDLRVLLTGGGSISLNNPIANRVGNTLTLSPNAAVISVSGTAQVRQGP